MKISNIFYLLIFLFIKSNAFEVPPHLKAVCPQGCKRYFNCDEQQKKCVYKGFFPIYRLEFLEIIILMTSSSLATSCGIGGGTVYSSMILGVEEFEPSEAFPIANFLILLCGLITFTSFAMDKYEHPKNIFVHYDIATVFGPSMLLGAKFGTILNRMLSSTILLIFLLVLLIYTCSKTYKNILKARAKEQKLLEGGGPQLNQPLLEKDKEEEKEDLSNLTEEEKERLAFIKEEENPLNWPSIIFLLIMELMVIIDQFIEGSNKVPSFIGLQRCSFWYWASFSIYVILTLICVKLSISYILVKVNRKKELLKDYNSEVMENVQNHIAYIVTIGIFAGIVSSSLGIGGGMITNPVFSGLGMDPKQSSSTSNFLIIVTAIASSFIFVLSGQLNIVYSLNMGMLCTAAAFVGSFFILKYINRTGKSSILLVIMEYFLIASFFIALYKLITNDTQGYGFIGHMFKLNNYC
jgi:uncharacterized membrane protein YfcA